jgi:hypothetical protein
MSNRDLIIGQPDLGVYYFSQALQVYSGVTLLGVSSLSSTHTHCNGSLPV